MNSASQARSRQPKSATRLRILQRANEMYLARELEPGDEKLVVVLDSLGYTTGAGYQIWPNQRAFREELTIYIAENLDHARVWRSVREIVDLSPQDRSFEEHVLYIGDALAEAVLHSEEFFLALRFFAMPEGGPAAITQALQTNYENANRETGALFAEILERFQRQLKAPLEIADLATAVCATLEGAMLRARVQPEMILETMTVHGGEHHVFSLAFLAIFESYTEAIQQ